MYTLRPDTHYRGFWAPWEVVLVSLIGKLKHDRWIAEYAGSGSSTGGAACAASGCSRSDARGAPRSGI